MGMHRAQPHPGEAISVAELGKDSSLSSHGRIDLATSQAASFKTSGPSRKHLWKEDSLETRARDEAEQAQLRARLVLKASRAHHETD